MRSVIPMLAAVVVMGVVGCSRTQERTYDVTVRNAATRPITIWLTKDGGPPERGWSSPEDFAFARAADDERIAGVVVPPGKTAGTGPMTGAFDPGSNAMLRVYAGERRLNELLAMSRGSGERLDLMLYPGGNQIVVKEEGGRLVSEREER